MNGTKVFICYSHKDKKLARVLMQALQPLEQRDIISTICYEIKLRPGDDRAAEVKKQMEQAKIILCLISPDFLSHYQAQITSLQRQEESSDVNVVFVLLRFVNWPEIESGKLKVFPMNGKPISAWSNITLACLSVAQDVLRLVEGLNSNAAKTSNDTSTPPVSGTTSTSEKSLVDLESTIRRSYLFVRDYENVFRLSSDPKEKLEAVKLVKGGLVQVQELVSKYLETATEHGVIVPEDIMEVSARLDGLERAGNIW